MADILGFESAPGLGFLEGTDTGVAVGTDGAVSLIQSWNAQYQAQPTPIYECGTSRVHYGMKHPSGSFTAERIVSGTFTFVTSIFGTLCNRETVNLAAPTGCGEDGQLPPVTFEMHETFITGVTFGGQAQNSYVTESLSAQFGYLTEA